MKSRRGFHLFLALALFFAGCSERKPAEQMTDDQLRAHADELAHKYIILDGHVDLPEHLMDKKTWPDAGNIQVLLNTPDGEFDYELSRKGGLDAPFMSIYISVAQQRRSDRGKAAADSLIMMVKAIAANLPDKFALANSVEDVEKNFRDGKISLPMGMENGAPIGDDIANVKYFYDQGIRYVTLTHNGDNQICGSSRDLTNTVYGLTPYGRDVVAEMNRVGIMVDISHVDDSTFYQVMELSKAPCIASHSSCRYFSPTIMRDMTDDMIRVMGEHGGVILVNFYTNFLSDKMTSWNSRVDSLLKARGLKETDSLAKVAYAEFKAANPPPVVDVKTVADHIDHIVQLAGIDHVGFGSDFDGVGGRDNLPEGLKDASQYPNLIFELLKRGYTDTDIEKICSGNAFRVWKKVAEVAKGS